MSKTPSTISYYKAPKGLFLKLHNQRHIGFADYLINDKPLVSAHGSGWFFLEGEQEITKLSEKESARKITVGFRIKDKSLVSDRIPEFIPQEIARAKYDHDAGAIVWEKYDDIKSLYLEETKLTPDCFIVVDFTLDYLGEIQVENVNVPKDMVYTVYRSDWKSEGTKPLDLSSVARWEDLDRMLLPEFALLDRPCCITSKQTFDIVRHYVNTHIDTKESAVVSDYDFCFRVKKKIAIKPYAHQTEIKKINGRSYARPKIKTKIIDHKQVDIFEMTSKEKKYDGYTPIEGFKGNSITDLAENVKLFLDELMAHINTPVKECECCGGTGHILPDAKRARN